MLPVTATPQILVRINIIYYPRSNNMKITYLYSLRDEENEKLTTGTDGHLCLNVKNAHHNG